jgi:hypothetical protein
MSEYEITVVDEDGRVVVSSDDGITWEVAAEAVPATAGRSLPD